MVFRLDPEIDDLLDADDLQFLFLCHAKESTPAHHVSFGIHYLTNDGSRFMTRQPAQINSRFRMTTSHQNATLFGHHGKQMTRLDKIIGLAQGIGNVNCSNGALFGRDAG